jgi:hypothetical protein
VRACPATMSITRTHERATLASSATCSLRLTRCVLSLGTLTDPAKGARCAHLPQCNYETLRDHTSRVRTCPVAGCVALLQRSHDIERDDALAAQLRQLPLGTARVWVRGAEVRADTAAVKQTRSSQGHGKSNLVVLD